MQQFSIFSLLVASVVGASCFAVRFRTPPRFAALAVILGVFASMSLRLAPQHWHASFKAFMVAFCLGLLAHGFAKITRQPAQAFLVPSIIFLVPGTQLYRGFSEVMTARYELATADFVSAAMVSLAISFALLLANWLFPTRKSL